MSQNKTFIEEAIKHLDLAQKGINKPVEDVVGFSVCQHAQQSIFNFLSAYLDGENESVTDNTSIGELYNRCVAINPEFSKVDLSNVMCLHEKLGQGSCSGVKKVTECFAAADKIDDFFREKGLI